MATKPKGQADEFYDHMGAFRARSGIVFPIREALVSDWEPGEYDGQTFREKITSRLYMWVKANAKWEPVGGATWGAKEW